MEKLPTELFTQIFSLMDPIDRLKCTWFEHQDGCEQVLRKVQMSVNLTSDQRITSHAGCSAMPDELTLLQTPSHVWNETVLKYATPFVTIFTDSLPNCEKNSLTFDMSKYDMRYVTHLDIVIGKQKEKRKEKIGEIPPVNSNVNSVKLIKFRNVTEVEELRIFCNISDMSVYVSCTDDDEADWPKLKRYESSGSVKFRNQEIPDVTQTVVWDDMLTLDSYWRKKMLVLLDVFMLDSSECNSAVNIYSIRPNVERLTILNRNIVPTQIFADAFSNVKVMDLRMSNFTTTVLPMCFPSVDLYMGRQESYLTFPNCTSALIDVLIEGAYKSFPKLKYLSCDTVKCDRDNCMAHAFRLPLLEILNVNSLTYPTVVKCFPKIKCIVKCFRYSGDRFIIKEHPITDQFVAGSLYFENTFTNSVRTVSEIAIPTNEEFLKKHGSIKLDIFTISTTSTISIEDMPKEFYMEMVKRQEPSNIWTSFNGSFFYRFDGHKTPSYSNDFWKFLFKI